MRRVNLRAVNQSQYFDTAKALLRAFTLRWFTFSHFFCWCI